MASPHPLPPIEEMRKLAERMARVSPEAKSKLALLIGGSTTAWRALPVFRREVIKVAKSDSPKVPKDLRTDLLVWLGQYGGRVRNDGAEPKIKQRWDISVEPELFDEAKRAAALFGVSVPEFVKSAVAEAAERALKGQ